MRHSDGAGGWFSAAAVVLAVVVLAALLVACGGPAGGNSLTLVEVVELDMHMPEGGTATATGPVLEAGRTYTITIAGTYSIWGFEWDSGSCQGVSEAEPMFPSPGSENGVVGIDAEFYFAVPNGSALCWEEIPRGTGAVDFSLDGGATFDHPDPVVPPAAPRADHTYVYEVVGEGYPIQFEREDSPSSDNYGVLKITVEVE